MMMYFYAMATLATVGGGLAILLLIAYRFIANYGECTLQINEEEPIKVEGGGKLLDALYENKIFIPSACGGQGTCGFCKCQVKEGGGPVLPTETPYLSAEEQDNDTRLACQVKVKEDMLLHVREDFLSIKEYRSVITKAELITGDTREIRMKLLEPDTISFKPGQYMQVRIPGHGDSDCRAYSLASPPSVTDSIELLVRLIPGGLGSTYLHNVAIDEDVALLGPYGEFILDESQDNQLICVGGGCGMAPMRSILRHVADVQPQMKCWLFFGARTTADIMYNDEFGELKKRLPNLSVHYALSEPQHSPEWTGETGFIHESVDTHMPTDGKRQAFLCGPPLMIEATMKVLDSKNVPKDRVFYDEF